ncbi:LemA family protein [Vibrio sp. RE86]|uniref:LemA family protein n=1 Tax=Vibrio sp. RE86 TaxID=2607605 RepID=UPI0014934C84|nr:LemA family protein [Vibrio sp. RE86]NOH79304.1 LemA family protein [Vibrio sp. RE86]
MDYIGFAIIILLAVWLVSTYNTLIAKKNRVLNADSSIDVMLKQRYDLIPQIVETVKVHIDHEQSTLLELTELRTQALSCNTKDQEMVDIESRVSKVLPTINMLSESYPDLKSSDAFLALQRSLNETEAQLSAARRTYNAAVTDLNNAIEMVPSNIMAKFMGLSVRALFDVPVHETERPNISEGLR